MGYLIGEIVVYLVLPLGAGTALGWWLRTLGVSDRISQLRRDWAKTNHALTKERDSLRVAFDSQALRVATLEQETDERGVRLREMEAERDSASSVAASAKASLDLYRRQVETLEEKATQRHDALQRELSLKTMAVETLQTELGVVQDSRRRRDLEIQGVRNQLARAESQAYHESRRLDSLRRERDRLRDERESLGAALIAARSDIDRANEALGTLRAQAISLGESADQIRDRDAASYVRIAELERLLGIERNQAAVLREELREQSQQLALVEDGQAAEAARLARADEIEEKLEELQRETEQLREELRIARRATARAEAERSDALVEIDELEKRSKHDAPAPPETAIAAVEVTPARLPEAARPSWLLRRPDGEVDDLKQIRGIGPVLEQTMHELGIFHFRQIARWADDDVEWATRHLDAFPGRIERDEWIEQAGTLHRSKYGTKI